MSMICADESGVSLLSTLVPHLLYESIVCMLVKKAIRVFFWLYRSETKRVGRFCSNTMKWKNGLNC